MVAYRFKANGDLDPSFGTGGVTRYDAGIGQEDRGRDINVTSEGRIVIAGSSAQGAGDLIAAVYLLRPNGQFEKTFGDGGAMKVDIGGTGDAFFGLSDTASDTRATVAGYKAVGRRSGRRRSGRAAQPRPPEHRSGRTRRARRAAACRAQADRPARRAPPPRRLVNRKAKIGTMKLAGSTVSVPLTCAAGSRCKGTVRLRSVAPVRVGRSMKVISVTRTAAFNITAGTKTVRLALSKDGRTVLKRAKRLSVKVVVDPATGSLVTKRGTLRALVRRGEVAHDCARRLRPARAVRPPAQ